MKTAFKIIFSLALAIILSSIPNLTFSQTKDNSELKSMYSADQGARKVANINWKELNKQDSLRQLRVYELLKSNAVVTGQDYYHSAMIFQHGNDTVASGMAVKLMKVALEKDSTVNRWLLAAAIDRDLMRKNQPQIYGTQFVKLGADAKWERDKIDTTKITDDQRKYYRVETLKAQRIKEHKMNLKSLSDFYNKKPSISEITKLIKRENQLKAKSSYDADEDAINSFAYEVLNSGKTEDALKIFKLNTELYPKGYNTFDSYGECLLKLKRKKEAIVAYKKSVQLNPENENGIKVLKELSAKP